MKIKLYWQILISIGVAIAVGLASMYGVDKTLTGVSLLPAFSFIGDLFLNALKMVVVPLIASSIITSIAGLKDIKGLGRLGGKTILFYIMTSLLAILVGLAMVNLIKPGVVDGKPASEIFSNIADKQTDDLKQTIAESDAGKIRDVLVNIVPSNVISSAADNGKMLSLIVFCIFFCCIHDKNKTALS